MRTLLLLVLVSVLGLLLRSLDYATVPPADENFDEVHYAWGGGTWIEGGVPRSWSYYESYEKSQLFAKFDKSWKIVEPVIEKPPLYFWLSGVVVSAFGPNNVFDVDHSVIRILPLVLSLFSIFLTGFLAKKVFGDAVGAAAALIYAVLPTVVMGNRLSVTENLLTPLLLALAIILVSAEKIKNIRFVFGVFALSLLAALTKHIGIAAGIGAGVYFLAFKNLRLVFSAILGTVAGVFIFVAIGFIYDATLFLNLMRDLKVHVLSGLPSQIPVIFAYQGISAKNRLFFDESILVGLILLFSSPFIFRDQITKKDKKLLGFLVLPLIYITAMVLGQTGSGAFDYFVIYIYPLFPFAIILLSYVLTQAYKSKNILGLSLLFFVLGSGTLRFILIGLPRDYHYLWQNVFVGITLVSVLFYFVFRKYWRIWLIVLFGFYLAANIFAVINLKNTYEPSVRHLQDVYESFEER